MKALEPMQKHVNSITKSTHKQRKRWNPQQKNVTHQKAQNSL
jgi:hypothetical protein